MLNLRVAVLLEEAGAFVLHNASIVVDGKDAGVALGANKAFMASKVRVELLDWFVER